jgi:hypothetical protein
LCIFIFWSVGKISKQLLSEWEKQSLYAFSVGCRTVPKCGVCLL